LSPPAANAGKAQRRQGKRKELTMPPLAERNLVHDKVRLAVTLTGIIFAVVLIVVQLGLFIGFATTTSGKPRRGRSSRRPSSS